MAVLMPVSSRAGLAALVAGLGLVATGCSIDRQMGRFPAQEAADGAVDAPTMDPEPDQGPPPDLTDPAGHWMLFVEDRNCLVDAGDPIESLIWSWYRVELVPSADGRASLTLRSRICKQELSPLAFGFLSLVPDATTDSGEEQETAGFLVGESSGALFLSDTIVDYWGVQGLSFEDMVPASADDERVVDQDGDGNPGVTFPVVTTSGLEICEVYVAQRIRAGLEGRVRNARRIDGDALTGTDKAVLAASTGLCASGDVVPNMAGNTFSLVRIDGVDGSPDADLDGDGTIACAEIREELPALMAAYGLERSEPDSDRWCPP